MRRTMAPPTQTDQVVKIFVSEPFIGDVVHVEVLRCRALGALEPVPLQDDHPHPPPPVRSEVVAVRFRPDPRDPLLDVLAQVVVTADVPIPTEAVFFVRPRTLYRKPAIDSCVPEVVVEEVEPDHHSRRIVSARPIALPIETGSATQQVDDSDALGAVSELTSVACGAEL